MAEAPRRQARDGNQPANDDRAPQPRLVVDNSARVTGQRPHRPILYKGYVLRHKTPEEWEEFGRLNPDIDPAFWDSPVINKREDLKTKRSLKKQMAGQQKPRRTSKQLPYGVTPEDSRVFRKDIAEQRRQNRKRRVASRKAETELRKQRREFGAATSSGTTLSRAGGLVVGPKRAAVVQNPVTAIGTNVTASFSMLLVGGWFPFQLALGGLAFTMLGMGGIGITGTSSLFGWLEEIGINIVLQSLALLFGGFMAAGLAVWTFAVIISLIQLFIIYLLLKASGAKPIAGDHRRFWKKLSFAVAILGSVLPLFFVVVWWVNVARSNPG